MSLAAADEDRSCAVAVTSGTAALLVAQLLASTGNFRALASGAGNPASVLKLPGYHPVEDVGTRLNAEYCIVQFNVALAGAAL